MTKHVRFTKAFIVAFLGLSAEAIGSDARFVISPDVRVAGINQSAWSVSWWQWAASFEHQESPISDRTGARCAAGQDGPVWFLAGVYGSAPVKRSCEVPAGKFLFFPIVNYVIFPRGGATPSCAHLEQSTREYTDDPTDLTVFVDGSSVHNLSTHRQASAGCFDLGTRAGESVYPSASNGYYVMLEPLPPGRHEIRWGGVLPTLRQAVIYEILVRETVPSDSL